MSDIKKVKVKNNTTHDVGYTMQNSGLVKNWLPGQTIMVKLEEIEEGLYEPGIKVLFTEGLLIMENPKDRIACGLAVEDENNEVIEDITGVYTKEQITKALQSDKLIDLVEILRNCTKATQSAVVDTALELGILDGKKNAEIVKYTGKDVIAIYQYRKRLEEDAEEK